MATGTGLGSLIPVAMVLVGFVTMLKTSAGRRAKRRSGQTPDTELEKRQAAAAEMERRMASYLAQRDTRGSDAAQADENRQENGR